MGTGAGRVHPPARKTRVTEKRRFSNQRSATRSRVLHKAYVKSLEEDMVALKARCCDLDNRVALLQHENDILRDTASPLNVVFECQLDAPCTDVCSLISSP